MNLPQNSNAKDLPEDARGNPAYEQTRQDMPLWCCGTNCGRNTRFTVLILCLVGIAASVFTIISADYFSFVSFRNDTFYDEDKRQPEPFEYATEARVGLFKYEITDVYVYPWPPKVEFPGSRWLQNEAEVVVGNATDTDAGNTTDTDAGNTTDTTPTTNTTDANATNTNATNVTDVVFIVDGNETASDVPTEVPASGVPSLTPTAPPSLAPSSAPTTSFPSAIPTSEPTTAPTSSDPNIQVEESTQLNTVIKYDDGRDQFDAEFSKAQLGALLGPVFAAVATVFGLIELCCCTYKCSWLPTCVFMYLAFMFQGFTLFLFLSEDFCKYAQDCSLGMAGVMSVIAILCYMISNCLLCMSPRPDPYFNLCKKPPTPKKKKKKKKARDPEQDQLNPGYDPDDPDAFRDEPDDEGYVDPYADDDEDYYSDNDGDEYDDSYIPPDTFHTLDDDDVYNDNFDIGDDEDDDSYAADTFGGDTYGQDTYGDQSALAEDSQMTDGGWSDEDESEMGSKFT